MAPPASPLLPGIPLSDHSFISPGRTHSFFLCALCSAELAHCFAHLVLPLVHHPAWQLRSSFAANCIELRLSGLQPLCFSVPFTFYCLTLISCSSSPLNLSYALTSYECYSDSDVVGKNTLSFRGKFAPSPQKRRLPLREVVFGGKKVVVLVGAGGLKWLWKPQPAR